MTCPTDDPIRIVPKGTSGQRFARPTSCKAATRADRRRRKADSGRRHDVKELPEGALCGGTRLGRWARQIRLAFGQLAMGGLLETRYLGIGLLCATHSVPERVQCVTHRRAIGGCGWPANLRG